MLKEVLLVGCGGFIGSVARYYVSKLNLYISFFSIPFGTLIVNVLGSLLMGFLVGISLKNSMLPLEWKLFLMVGICGGFTTFSAFTAENLVLLQNGQFLSVALYTGLSILLGFVAVYAGYAISNMI